jgi:hypothetical protein
LAEASEEGQGLCSAVEAMVMMMMMIVNLADNDDRKYTSDYIGYGKIPHTRFFCPMG